MAFNALAQFLGTIGADGNDLVAEVEDLGLDLEQLTQLLVAVRSPTSAIEDQDGGLRSNHVGEGELIALHGSHRRRGDRVTGHDRVPS